MSSYQPGIPTGTVNLSVDYQNIQNNFQQLDTSFGVDHVPFSDQTSKNGYHTNIHANPFSTTATNPPNNYVPSTANPVGVPTASPGFGQLFSSEVNDGFGADQSLYWLTGANKLLTLTRNLQPLGADNGYTFLPGGIIVQWGRKSSIATSFQVLDFVAENNVYFPKDCFAVFTQPFSPGSVPSHSATFDIRLSKVGRKSFEWVYVSQSNTYSGFFWLAIGI